MHWRIWDEAGPCHRWHARDRRGCRTITGLKGLVRLELPHNPLASIEPLRHLAALRRLDLDSSATGDLRPLEGLRRLEILSLAGNGVVDLSPLAGLTRLTHLKAVLFLSVWSMVRSPPGLTPFVM